MSDWEVEVVVPGAPIGKGRPRGTAAGGYVKLYTPKRTADWERAAALLARNLWHRAPLEGEIEVEVDAVFPRPKRLLRKKDPEGRMWHISKPDIDNVVKSSLDMAVMAGLMRDDSQVVKLSARSLYASKSEGPSLVFRMRLMESLPG